MMRAAYYEGKGTIRVGECKPVFPGPGEVQLKVSHCGLCGTDLHLFHGAMDHRVHLPQVIGHEMSGTVAEVGEGVIGFRPGDPVTVRPLDPCGVCPACHAGHSHICQRLKFIGIDAPGALQARWCVPAHTLHRLPPSLPLDHAALVEPLAVACHDVQVAGVQAGEFVVVQGGGPIGILIACVAREQGARVLVSEVNPFRVSVARELKFETCNPNETDIVKCVDDATGGAGADVVFEVSGSAPGAESMTKLARTRGRIVVVAIFAEKPRIDLFHFFWRELRLLGARLYQPEDFEHAIKLASSGRLPLDKLISTQCPLDEVESALRQLASAGALMKVLVRCSED